MLYKISCSNPLTKRLQISIDLSNVESEVTKFHLPKWRPGRYEFGSFAAHVYRPVALGAQGEAIPIIKEGTHTWVSLNGQHINSIEYEVFANRLDAGGTFVHEDFWLINPINCLVYCEELIAQECRLSVDLPTGFSLHTSLLGRDGELVAGSFDELVDSPILLGRSIDLIEFQVDQKPFQVCIQGDHSLNKETLVSDMKRYTEEQMSVFSVEDLEVYKYLIVITPYKSYHGVEHMDSTVIVLGESGDSTFYENLMGVCSHELFHYWNIKRIRPKGLSPYDFSRENYFNTGYVVEGFTTYYGDLFLVRGGVFGEDWYLKELDKLLKRHMENYGRLGYSVADSSLDLWVDGYRKGAPNRKVSIYVKGALIALMLDLKIRSHTHGEKSLDDVMRRLLYEFNPMGYAHHDIKRITSEIAGQDLDQFFAEYVDGTMPLENELPMLLREVGLEAKRFFPNDSLVSDIGLKYQKSSEGLKVIEMAPHSIAERHLSVDDLIISVNDQTDDIELHMENRFKIARYGKHMEITVPADSQQYYGSLKVSVFSNTTSQQLALKEGWLGSKAVQNSI